MKVKELIERLEQIPNKEMEVFVLNQFDGFSDIYEVEQFTNCVAISGDIKSEYQQGEVMTESDIQKALGRHLFLQNVCIPNVTIWLVFFKEKEK